MIKVTINASHPPPREIQTAALREGQKNLILCEITSPLFAGILQALMPLSTQEQSPHYRQAVTMVAPWITQAVL